MFVAKWTSLGQVSGMAIFADAEVSAFVDDVNVVIFAHFTHQLPLHSRLKLGFLAEMAQSRLAHLSELLFPSPQNTTDRTIDQRIAHCSDRKCKQ